MYEYNVKYQYFISINSIFTAPFLSEKMGAKTVYGMQSAGFSEQRCHPPLQNFAKADNLRQ